MLGKFLNINNDDVSLLFKEYNSEQYNKIIIVYVYLDY